MMRPSLSNDVLRKLPFTERCRNRQGPGQGMLRFAPILQALKDVDHQGSVEPDCRCDGAACAAGYLRGLLEVLA